MQHEGSRPSNEQLEQASRDDLIELIAAQQSLIDQLSRRLAELDENAGDFEMPRAVGWRGFICSGRRNLARTRPG